MIMCLHDSVWLHFDTIYVFAVSWCCFGGVGVD